VEKDLRGQKGIGEELPWGRGGGSNIPWEALGPLFGGKGQSFGANRKVPANSQPGGEQKEGKKEEISNRLLTWELSRWNVGSNHPFKRVVYGNPTMKFPQKAKPILTSRATQNDPKMGESARGGMGVAQLGGFLF